MLRKLTENLLTIIVTVVLVGVVAGIMLNHYSSNEQAALTPLREQNEALRAQLDENRRDLEATAQLIRQNVPHQSDAELARVNTQKVDALADALAQRMTARMPAPQSADELARQENRQIDRISSATAEKLQPAIQNLTTAARHGSANAAQVAAARAESDRLRDNLAQTQKAADDALQLTRQLSTMYLETYRDKGALVHIISLPAELIQDTARGNFLTGDRARSREQKELDQKVKEIEDRLNQIKATAGQPVAVNN
jgi:uncharacterized phage infection (PIP) family protein YhgE